MKSAVQRVCISDSVHSLLLYLLYSSPEEIHSTFFFLSDGIHPSIRSKIPNLHYIPTVWFRKTPLRKFFFLIYLILLRLFSRFRWPFLKNAQLFVMDQLHFAGPLVGFRKYTALADGPNCFANLRGTPDYQTVTAPGNRGFRMKLVRFFLGACWHQGHGSGECCEGILSSTPDLLDFQQGKRHSVYSLETLWAASDSGKRRQIFSFFDLSEEDLARMKSRSVILLTQQLATEGTVTEEELAGIYRKLLAPYPPSAVLIKRHPRDRMDYQKYFPEAIVYEKFAPMQLFALSGITFQTAVTLFSSSVLSFEKVTIVWGGSEVHPNILRRYGKQVQPVR